MNKQLLVDIINEELFYYQVERIDESYLGIKYGIQALFKKVYNDIQSKFKKKEISKIEQDEETKKLQAFLNKINNAKTKEEAKLAVEEFMAAYPVAQSAPIKKQIPTAVPPMPPKDAYENLTENLREEIKMKITQQQLKQMINEEIAGMIQEGLLTESQLQELSLKGIKGAAGALGGAVGGLAKGAGQAVAGAARKVGAAAAAPVKAAAKYGKEVGAEISKAATKGDIESAIDSAVASLQSTGSNLLKLQQKAVSLGIKNLNLSKVQGELGRAVQVLEAELQKVQQQEPEEKGPYSKQDLAAQIEQE